MRDSPGGYESALARIRGRFAERWAIEGSRLDALAHRLKILWKVRSVAPAGSVVVLFDLFPGIARALR